MYGIMLCVNIGNYARLQELLASVAKIKNFGGA